MGENRWVWAAMGRCLEYGAGMCFYFFFVCIVTAVLLGAALALPISIAALYLPSLDGWSLDNFCTLSGVCGLVIGCGSAVVGAVAGVIAGFCSPREDKNYDYFCAVFLSGLRWLCYGLLSGLACGAAMGLVLWLFLSDPAWGMAPIVPLAWLGQGYGLWRGINEARRSMGMVER